MYRNNISPLDSRYYDDAAGVAGKLNETTLVKNRVRVEVRWLIMMSQCKFIPEVREMTEEECAFLDSIWKKFDENDLLNIKSIEKEIRHDVKSVEYFVRDKLKGTSLSDYTSFVHFGCTSEDISNLAYALMLKDAIGNEYCHLLSRLMNAIASMAKEYRSLVMLSHTHGQPATPTTMGKELAVFLYRLNRQLHSLEKKNYLGKFNGVVGAYNAQKVAYPGVDWISLSKSFVEDLGLTFNPLTTQIESHDYMAEIFDNITRINSILIGFCQDIWSYISKDYLVQKVISGEVGSSTMPHKVNPIDFETAEGCLGVSSSMLSHLSSKLLISRLQRDLSDSTTQRNIGPAVGYSSVALNYILRGLSRIEADRTEIGLALQDKWELMGEPIQTVLRKLGFDRPYEQMKELTRGRKMSRGDIHSFINNLAISQVEKSKLTELSPITYKGYAEELVDYAIEQYEGLKQ